MSAASSNRGSIVITREIRRDFGTWREPREPAPRPVDWGDKAHARALDRARRILAGNARCGRTLDLETLTACIVDRARVGRATALAAAEAVLRPTENS